MLWLQSIRTEICMSYISPLKTTDKRYMTIPYGEK
uniref:Uncharacterized protein n=1 Tax=Rhizophora mucronata TaxID=61149 RepID=A0A2P2KR69_RHIMU